MKGDRRLRGATDHQLKRATGALFDIRQTHLSAREWEGGR